MRPAALSLLAKDSSIYSTSRATIMPCKRQQIGSFRDRTYVFPTTTSDRRFDTDISTEARRRLRHMNAWRAVYFLVPYLFSETRCIFQKGHGSRRSPERYGRNAEQSTEVKHGRVDRYQARTTGKHMQRVTQRSTITSIDPDNIREHPLSVHNERICSSGVRWTTQNNNFFCFANEAGQDALPLRPVEHPLFTEFRARGGDTYAAGTVTDRYAAIPGRFVDFDAIRARHM